MNFPSFTETINILRPRRIVLIYISMRAITLYWHDGKTLVALAVFEVFSRHENLAMAQKDLWLQWLKANARLPVGILIESADQVYTPEKIPFVLGLDRISLLQRKVHNMGESTLASYYSLGRSPVGQKEENLLILALGDTAHWQSWLQDVQRAGLQVMAVSTPTLMTASSALHIRQHEKELASHTDGVSLRLSWHSGGLSQSVLDHGKPLLSRLTPWGDEVITYSSTSGWHINNATESCLAQTRRLLDFLQGRGLWTPALKVLVTVVLPPSFAQLGEAESIIWPAWQGVTWQTLVAPSPEPIEAQRVAIHGILELPSDNQLFGMGQSNKADQVWIGAETLSLQEMATLNDIMQVAPTALRYRYLVWLAKRWGLLIMAGIVGLFLLIAIYYGVVYLVVNYRNNTIRDQFTTIEQQYEEKTKLFPSIGVSNDTLRAVIDFKNISHQCFAGRADELLQLSQINLKHPRIDLKKIDWAQDQMTEKGEYEATTKCTIKIMVSGEITASSEALQPSADGEAGQRDIQNRFNAWKTDIAHTMNAKVMVMTEPLKLSEGKFTDKASTHANAPFTVEMTITKTPNPSVK